MGRDLVFVDLTKERLAAMPAGDEIGVGARNGVEQLAEDHKSGSTPDMTRSNHDVRFTPKADIRPTDRDVCFGPKGDIVTVVRHNERGRQLSFRTAAKTWLEERRRKHPHRLCDEVAGTVP